MKTLLSNCCGSEIFDTDIQVCPSCGEPCVFEEVNEDAESDAKEDMIGFEGTHESLSKLTIMEQLSGIVEATEDLKRMMK